MDFGALHVKTSSAYKMSARPFGTKDSPSERYRFITVDNVCDILLQNISVNILFMEVHTAGKDFTMYTHM